MGVLWGTIPEREFPDVPSLANSRVQLKGKRITQNPKGKIGQVGKSGENHLHRLPCFLPFPS